MPKTKNSHMPQEDGITDFPCKTTGQTTLAFLLWDMVEVSFFYYYSIPFYSIASNNFDILHTSTLSDILWCFTLIVNI